MAVDRADGSVKACYSVARAPTAGGPCAVLEWAVLTRLQPTADRRPLYGAYTSPPVPFQCSRGPSSVRRAAGTATVTAIPNTPLPDEDGGEYEVELDHENDCLFLEIAGMLDVLEEFRRQGD
jgi:hypothetical protein